MQIEIKPCKILIADDHPLVRAGAKAALEQATNFDVVGECCGADEVLKWLDLIQPDLLILDILMGRECSLEWLDRYRAASPRLRVLVLSSLKSGQVLKLVSHALVCGYVLKDEASEHLLQAVRVVTTGGTWFSRSISAELRRMSDEDRKKPQYHLTPREAQVFQGIKTAQTNASIAADLGVSVHTVRRSISIIYSKLGVSGRVEAIVRSS